jgi:hypothetical protein
MEKQSQALKLRVRMPKKGIYKIILDRIRSCETTESNIVTFPIIFSKLCVSLQLNKKQVWDLLLLFNDLGYIRIICGHGVKIK